MSNPGPISGETNASLVQDSLRSPLRVPRSAPIGSAVVPDMRIEVDKALVTTQSCSQ